MKSLDTGNYLEPNSLKFLCLLAYYNRPRLVFNALKSLQDSTYKNYEVAFCDDGSEYPGKQLIENQTMCDLSEVIARTKWYRLEDTIEQKKAQGQSRYGLMLNQAIRESSTDIVVFICDDDYLKADYLEKLNKFYIDNPNINYSYSHFILFNALEETYEQTKDRIEASDYLKHVNPINPFNAVDASQTTFRRKCFIESNIWFDEFRTTNLDADIHAKFWHNYGECVWNGLIGQFKNWSHCQLGNRHNRGILFEEAE